MSYNLSETKNRDDLSEIFKMRVKLWEGISDVDTKNHPNGMIEGHDSNPNTTHYVMKYNNKIIGGARLKMCYQIEDIPDYEVYLERDVPFTFPIGHLGKLIILPEYHGQGLSRNFDQVRYQKAQELGAKMILGWTHINSKRLHHKIHSDGFSVSGQINIDNFTGNWELGNGEIIYKLL